PATDLQLDPWWTQDYASSVEAAQEYYENAGVKASVRPPNHPWRVSMGTTPQHAGSGSPTSMTSSPPTSLRTGAAASRRPPAGASSGGGMLRRMPAWTPWGAASRPTGSALTRTPWRSGGATSRTPPWLHSPA